jgi:transposase
MLISRYVFCEEGEIMSTCNPKEELIETFDYGTLYFIATLCRKMGVDKMFDKHMNFEKGRNSDLPRGLEAIMMIANLCDGGYRPLYLLKDYYREKDLEGIFHHDISLDQVNEDRFGHFLEAMYRCDPRSIFTDLSISIFLEYGIKVKNVNYDTTSLVCWGEYSCIDGKSGIIEINFGHSKQKRPDKKQLKLGIGLAEGVVVDAKVISGNKDDKTYNNENILDSIKLARRMGTPPEDFYYIADSALFNKNNLELLHGKNGCKYITRIPDNYKIAAELIEKGVNYEVPMEDMILTNKQREQARYSVFGQKSNYVGYDINMALVYSESLREIKSKSIKKKALEEYENLTKKITELSKELYPDIKAAEKSIKLLMNPKYHNVNSAITEVAVNKPGRPPKNSSNTVIKYKVEINLTRDDEIIEKHIRRNCLFVLVANDLLKAPGDILIEYKTQISAEKRFQQLKSPHFVHTLYLDKPERIEALCYILLIALMLLSVMEHQVRKGMKNDNETIIGPGSVKMKSPTLKAISGIFSDLRVKKVTRNDSIEWSLFRPLDDSRKKVFKYLDITENDLFPKH